MNGSSLTSSAGILEKGPGPRHRFSAHATPQDRTATVHQYPTASSAVRIWPGVRGHRAGLYIRGFYSYQLPAELCDRFSRDVMPLMPAASAPVT